MIERRLTFFGAALALLLGTCTIPDAMSATTNAVSDGVSLFQQGDYAHALAIFDKLVDASPTDSDAHFWRANCLSRLNRMKDAVAEYKLAYLLSADPKVKEYAKDVLTKYNALPKVASIAAVPVPKKPKPKSTDDKPTQSGKTFKLRTEELDWNLQFSQKFKASLSDRHQQLDSMLAKADKQARGPMDVGIVADDYSRTPSHNNTGLDSTEIASLQRYSVVIVLDHSSSMDHKDCPIGNPATGMVSRWDWCASELQYFGSQAKPCFPNGVTVIPFNDNYQKFTNCQAADLARISSTLKPNGGTNLTPAINAALSQLSGTNKRLAVIVITDGCPNDRDEVVKQIVRTTQTTHPNEVAVLFLTVGLDQFGSDFLDHLDNDLTGEGAKYDAVTAMPFLDLKKAGLGHALAKAVLTK